MQPLQGGIGNQLFQLCATLSLARRFGLRPAFDLSRYARDSYGRHSLLQRLWPGADEQTIAQLPPAHTRLLNEAQWTWPAHAPQPPALALPAGVQHLVLEGYWQDHRLVDPNDLARLRQHLALHCTTAAGAVAPALGLGLDLGLGPQAIAVHVRRHDYKHHGLCFERYYTEALTALLQADPQAPVLVFSDEPNYTRHFLQAAGIRHRLVRTGDDLLDLYLMSRCGRHVISNSSYSWWGARLADSAAVLWPSPWSRLHAESTTLCPPHWVRVPGAVDTGPVAAPWTQAAAEAVQSASQAKQSVAG